MIYVVDKWTNVCPHQQPCVPSCWETFLICPCLQLCCNIQVPAGWRPKHKSGWMDCNIQAASRTAAYMKLSGQTEAYKRLAGWITTYNWLAEGITY